jgi:hypothetical protein
MPSIGEQDRADFASARPGVKAFGLRWESRYPLGPANLLFMSEDKV